MKCADCGRCQSIIEKGDVYNIACLEKGGFQLHSTHEDNFNCEDFEERHEIIPPKNNVVVILDSGRDITLYNENIKTADDFSDRLKMANENDFIKIGNFVFSVKSIACMGVIDE